MRLVTRPRSLRARLALAFALGSATLLLAAGGFLYLNLNGELQTAINDGLRAREDDIAADIAGGAPQVPQQDAFSQIVDPSGLLLASSATIPSGRPVLRANELRRAGQGEVFIERAVPGLGAEARLLARTEMAGSHRVVVVVGTSPSAVARGRRRLGLVLAGASPLLLALFTGGGWLVAGAALRPVRRMTEEADAISRADTGQRLAQPAGDDEIAHLGKTLNAMLARIERSFARERAFLDDASHELRTPLAILRAELELALLHAEDGGTRVALASALEEVDRLARLADDLLVLARASDGRPPGRTTERVDVLALARRVGRRLAADGGPAVEVTGRSVDLAADPTSIERVLVNLVGNARRHAEGRVLVDVGGDGRSDVVLTVADDGAGFPPALLQRAFDRFARADPARGREGGASGLGLAIVDALAKAHGGSVEAGNGPPLGGAVVRVRLPRR